MIVLLTDYSFHGPYVGQLKARILEYSPSAVILDLMHDLPVFNITAAASLIPAITADFPPHTIFICVVDPGVGSDRRPVLLKTNNYYFVGPDNGIFNKLRATNTNNKLWEIMWRPVKLSNSFHGRDLFAVIAAQLDNKTLDFDNSLRQFEIELNSEPENTFQIIYFDGFGNAITSITRQDITESNNLKLVDKVIKYAPGFYKQDIAQQFWYYNSMNLVEIACNQSSAQNELNLSIGQIIEIL